LNLMPLFHVAGICDGLLPTHLVGGSCVLMRFRPEAALDLFEQERITATCAFDAMLDALRRAPGYERSRHEHWRAAGISGSERMFAELREAGVDHVAAGLGMTEASGDITYTRNWQSETERMRTLGLPLPGLELRIVDPETDQVCPAGETGEICVNGWSLCLGYIDDPSPIDSDGFLRTGDLGALSPAGALTLKGRLKEMIKTGGENVAPADVEGFLQRVPGVEAAAVVGVPDQRWGEMVVALVEFAPGSELPAEELRRACKETLAGYKVPKHFLVVDGSDWPLMAAGKLDRGALTALATERLQSHT
jgi:fatty-acyl-CoA synthase